MTSDRNLGHWALSLTKLTLFIEPLTPWKFHKPGLQQTWDTFQIRSNWNWKCCFYAPCKGIQIPESGKILLLESGIRSRNAESHKQRSDWNAESKFYRQILESSTIRNPQREIQNPRLSWIPSWGNAFCGEGKTGIPVRNTSRPSNEENPQRTQLWVYDWVYAEYDRVYAEYTLRLEPRPHWWEESRANRPWLPHLSCFLKLNSLN